MEIAKNEKPETPVITVTYRNWRGETAQRRVRVMSVRFGRTDYHPEPQYLLEVWDEDKGAPRTYALADCDFLSLHADLPGLCAEGTC